MPSEKEENDLGVREGINKMKDAYIRAKERAKEMT